MAREHALKTRADLHLARKIWHFLGVIFIMVLYHNLSRDTSIKVASAVVFIFVACDILRQHYSILNTQLLRVFRPIMREHERHQLAGTSFLLTGMLLIVYVFPKEIVDLALLFLAVGDPLASYMGLRYGRDKLIGSKSLQGTFAAFIACTLMSGVYYYAHELMVERLFIVSVLSGFIGAATELIPVGKLDDNFTFPVASASLLWVLFNVFGAL